MTDQTVRSRVDHASLWNTMMTDVSGRPRCPMLAMVVLHECDEDREAVTPVTYRALSLTRSIKCHGKSRMHKTQQETW
ncbi:UDP-N-acetylglucosamine--N-acetylmuramyl-(pentapeptide) pyrophosphoryl-undecaprenol N-acetylglucosamine transferase [Frankliniella fusca]|uniref:UDP-N-acetylglucosamine--N-acetylmuramyl-(Pentapeptide) pyrophosphoryl-undecaprenol N-acetylglucosamine transferase n=1 Tax=Frankliniella fusca TaxID=407009 RepID=A0AAE1HFU9_9NEOP|nr:UDP-N-acetylglucosamine--N-acetylmuramyl-(pentapeptide) pyrophosphoryl-undecaprenol N-acetylglucosamine transferase [Frankliniella fusca]